MPHQHHNAADLAIMLVTLIACTAIALTVWGVFELLEYLCQ